MQPTCSHVGGVHESGVQSPSIHSPIKSYTSALHIINHLDGHFVAIRMHINLSHNHPSVPGIRVIVPTLSVQLCLHMLISVCVQCVCVCVV